MSQRSTAPGRPSSSGKDASGQGTRQLEVSQPAAALVGYPSSPSSTRREIITTQEYALPRLQPLSATSEPRQQRPLQVHSILNPPHGLSPQPRGQRRSAAHLGHDPPNESLSETRDDLGGRPIGLDVTDDSRSRSIFDSSLGRSIRRILTPKSPAGRRGGMAAASTAAAFTYRQPSPYLSSEAHGSAAEASSASAMPSATGHSMSFRSVYNLPPLEPPQSYSARQRFGVGSVPQAPASDASSSASFSPSPHSFTSQTSPAGPFAQFPGSSSNPYASQLGNQVYPTGQSSAHAVDRQYGIPIATAGQSSVQLYTYETDRGPVQFPVDVQAGSRMADEKRKRNAGASARFRARRKEKEKEASSTISKLEQQLREAVEDCDFYKRERDYFAGIVYGTPGGARHFPRPPSPRLRRAAQTHLGGYGGEMAAPYGVLAEQGERRRSDEQGQRRMAGYELPPPSRIRAGSREGTPYGQPSSYQAAPPLPPPPHPPIQGQAGPGHGSALAPVPGTSAVPLALPPPPPPPPRSVPFDPFGPSRYDRGWHPG